MTAFNFKQNLRRTTSVSIGIDLRFWRSTCSRIPKLIQTFYFIHSISHWLRGLQEERRQVAGDQWLPLLPKQEARSSAVLEMPKLLQGALSCHRHPRRVHSHPATLSPAPAHGKQRHWDQASARLRNKVSGIRRGWGTSGTRGWVG